MKCIKAFVFLGTCLILLCNQAAALEVIGATPGDGGDNIETTFHFGANNVNFQMTLPDSALLTTGDLPWVYGSVLQIFNDGQDWVASKDLQVLGADLSGANWSNTAFPVQGTVAIDPALGRFKFASPSWERMGFINSTIGGLSGNPAQLVMHSDGSAICVYSQNGSGNGRIYASHFYPATGWQSAVIIDSVDTSVPTQHATAPRIAMDASGRAVCVFTQVVGTVTYRPHANVYLPGTGWQGVTLIDVGGDYLASKPRVAMANGKAIYVYQQRDASGNDRIYANEYTPASGWYGAVTIDADDTVHNQYPLIVINDSGRAFCAYSRDESPKRIHVNEYLPGAGWQGTMSIDPGTVPAHAIDLDINNAGFAVCLISMVASGSLVVTQAIEYAPGVGWAPSVEFASSTVTASYGTVSLNQAGQGVIAYIKEYGANLRIYAREYTSGVGWSGATLIDAGPGQDASSPQIALNDQGQAMCVFIQSDGTNDRIYANHFTSGLGWSGVHLLDVGLGYDTDNAEIAINSGGEAFCIWQQPDGIQNRVDVSRFQNEIPAGAMQVRYYYNDNSSTPLPTENALAIVNRKIEPLKGEKVSIQLALAQAGKTTIKIYTLQGRLVKTLANEYLAAGSYTFDWAALNDGGDLIASGVYIIRVQGPGVDETQKVVVIK